MKPALYVPLSAHATLGASSAERWMACPGSVKAEEGLPNVDTIYTAEGTAAHKVAELAYEYKRDPDLWQDQQIRVHCSEGSEVPYYDIDVTQEMVDAVRIYVRIIHNLRNKARFAWQEKKFDLRFPEDLPGAHGTSDHVAVEAEPGILDVSDLKYGKGVRKDAKDNPQVLMYALGAWLELMLEKPKTASRITHVRTRIVQPRIEDDGDPHISEDLVTIDELKEFGRRLLIAAKATMNPKAPRVAGDHCRFCKAKPTCQTFRGVALAGAKVDFKDVKAGVAPALPTTFDPQELSEVLDGLPMLEEWIKGVKQLAHHEVVVANRVIPGYARKEKGAHRKWGDEAMVKTWAGKHSIDERHLFKKPTMISPAQLESHLKSLAKPPAFPADLVAKREVIEYVLCKSDDPKAIRKGKGDFKALESKTGRTK